jgi:hypothetical protein
MSKSILRVGIAALVVALVVALPGTAAAQDQENATTRLYPIHNVRVDSAYTLAQSICEEAFSLARNAGDGDNGQRFICQVVAMSRNRTLAVSATPELHARIAGMLVEFDRMPETKAFHIIVLSAGTMTTDQDLDIPDGARRPLSDSAEFMPYSSFEVLGSGLLRTSSQAQTTLPGPMEFSVGIVFRPISEPQAPILIEAFEISQVIPAAYSPSGEVTRDAYSRQVLETTFTIEPGETVVVGTSKLEGNDAAVIVLLTAIQN